LDIAENDIVVNSWEELCSRLYDHSWKSKMERFRTDFAYRGVSEKEYQLKNRFLRNCGTDIKLEYHLLRNFRKYAKEGKESFSSDWRVLTLGQHYGLPTRLLDWTYSPFVAAHFATANISKYDKDGAIWMVDFVRVKKLLPEVLKSVLDSTGSNTFTLEMLEEAMPQLSDFDNISEQNITLFFEPPSLDDRIVNQYAFFSAMSGATAIMDDWLIAHPDIYQRIVIPAELKWEIRDKLDQANINERLLFPGLDGLANWLGRHYYPRK